MQDNIDAMTSVPVICSKITESLVGKWNVTFYLIVNIHSFYKSYMFHDNDVFVFVVFVCVFVCLFVFVCVFFVCLFVFSQAMW